MIRIYSSITSLIKTRFLFSINQWDDQPHISFCSRKALLRVLIVQYVLALYCVGEMQGTPGSNLVPNSKSPAGGGASEYSSFQHSQFVGVSDDMRPNVKVYEQCERLLRNGRLDSAVIYASEQSILAQQKNDIPTSIYCEWSAARALGRKGKSSDMFDRFFYALRLASSLQDKKKRAYWEGFIEVSVASMYVQNNVYERAEVFMERALASAEASGDSLLLASALASKAELEGSKQNYKRMNEVLSEAIRRLPSTKDTRGHAYFLLGTMYAKLGWAYLGRQNYDSALGAFRQAKNIFYETEEKRFISEALLGMADVYTIEQQYDSAAKMLDSAERAMNQMQLNIARFALYRSRAVLADSMKDYQSAYQYFRRFHDVRDSIYSNASAVKSEALKNEFMRQLEHERGRFNTMIIIMVIVILFMIIGVLWHRYRIKKQAEGVLLEQQQRLAEQAFQIQNANLELRQTNEELQMLNEMKNTFMGIATHDLKNPLTNITLSMGLVQKQVEELPEQVLAETTIMQHIDRVLLSAEFMRRIIQDLLDINKLESGTMVPEIKEVSMSILEQVAHMQQFYAEKKGITIHCEQSNKELANMIVYADERALIQVLDNLISNAVKYSPRNSDIWIRVQRASSPSTNHPLANSGEEENAGTSAKLCVEVYDQGPGLTEEDKLRVFEKFARLSAKPTDGESSTGLGLAISKELIRQMNGEIGCRSNQGRGAVFFVRLPLARTHNAEKDH